MLVRTNAILLNASPVGESDLFLIFFTEKLGKVKAIARGALRSQKRFTGLLLNLNHLEIELQLTKGLEPYYLLTLADLVKSRWSLSQNPEKLGCAYLLAELIEKATVEFTPEPILFELLQEGLDRMQKGRFYRERLFYYLLRLLEQLGYLPSLDYCVICGKKLRPTETKYYFSISQGGYGCNFCQKKSGKKFREVTPGFARTLNSLRRLTPDQRVQIRLLERDWRFGLELFDDFISWQLETSLSSIKFLKELEEISRKKSQGH